MTLAPPWNAFDFISLSPLRLLSCASTGLQQQALGVLGRDALIDQADIHDRDGDVGLGLLGHGLIGKRPGDDQEHQDGKRQSRIV